MKVKLIVLYRNISLVFMVVWLTYSEIPAQNVPLIGFDAEWRYVDGVTNAPPEWSKVGSDDSDWSTGQGGFGSGLYRSILGMAPVRTGLSEAFYYGNISVYFRTKFQFTNATEGVSLVVTNLLDDGAVFYLNGTEFARFGMPVGPISHSDLPNRSGAVDAHGADVFIFNPTNLLRGENILAVELHSIPGHRAFASAVTAWVPTSLRFAGYPQDLTVSNGWNASFQATVEGFPVFYQWQKDGVNIPSANDATLSFQSSPEKEGQYRVVVTNSLHAVTSGVVVLKVISDKKGPSVSVAIADNGFGPRAINIQFSEVLSSSSVRGVTNYVVTRFGTGEVIAVTNVLYSSALGALLQLDSGTTNWVPFADYMVTINNVADQQGNVIAPNTSVTVAWRVSTNLVMPSQVWAFHDSAVFDPGIYDESWFASDYLPSPWWGQGQGGFYGGPTVQFPCPQIASPQFAISWQPEPTLFRTAFRWPEDWPAFGTLRMRHGVDDGLVLYLNGSEVYRYNAEGVAGSPVMSTSYARSAASPSALCITNVAVNVSGLHPGTNWLAVAVVQSSAGSQDSYFVFDMTGTVLLGPALSPEPLPVLQATLLSADSVQLSWSGSGFALESSTNLDAGSSSYPVGPWTEVPQMSNPYLWPLTNGQQHYFRLKK